ncbi:helix-turn-helix domain-containing protein [Clostridium sp. Cult3]|uniref:helix-turn-helix domain-containing protein n=1 Tax=Clostridium sp. Cult3 TaxID=2079004 RepID=UPI001F17112B|nr:helix-turn-helix domain-containing protein [Clostridium sp. Cult3]MCF6461465.1 DNA-binding protein [Clostridium sp. Cult3]
MSTKKTYKTLEDLPLFMSVKDLADVLQLSEPKAREIAYSDGFPIMDRNLTGRRIVIPKMAFLNWAEQNMVFDYRNKEVI